MQRYGMVAPSHTGDGTMVARIKIEKGGHSRLAFFHVGLFVTASEGEELVVDIRHDGEDVTEFAEERRWFWRVEGSKWCRKGGWQAEKASRSGAWKERCSSKVGETTTGELLAGASTVRPYR